MPSERQDVGADIQFCRHSVLQGPLIMPKKTLQAKSAVKSAVKPAIKHEKSFEQSLWDTADQLRGSVESSEYIKCVG